MIENRKISHYETCNPNCIKQKHIILSPTSWVFDVTNGLLYHNNNMHNLLSNMLCKSYLNCIHVYISTFLNVWLAIYDEIAGTIICILSKV